MKVVRERGVIRKKRLLNRAKDDAVIWPVLARVRPASIATASQDAQQNAQLTLGSYASRLQTVRAHPPSVADGRPWLAHMTWRRGINEVFFPRLQRT